MSISVNDLTLIPYTSRTKEHSSTIRKRIKAAALTEASKDQMIHPEDDDSSDIISTNILEKVEAAVVAVGEESISNKLLGQAVMERIESFQTLVRGCVSSDGSVEDRSKGREELGVGTGEIMPLTIPATLVFSSTSSSSSSSSSSSFNSSSISRGERRASIEAKERKEEGESAKIKRNSGLKLLKGRECGASAGT